MCLLIPKILFCRVCNECYEGILELDAYYCNEMHKVVPNLENLKFSKLSLDFGGGEAVTALILVLLINLTCKLLLSRTWGVKFWDHPDTSQSAKFNNLLDITLGIHMGVRVVSPLKQRK